MKILTESELRAMCIDYTQKELPLPKGTALTPLAEEYLKERGIRVVFSNTAPGARETMPKTPFGLGDKKFVDAITGEGYAEKPEYMTHLHGNALVVKNHPQIKFRGQIDCLEAEFLEAQVLAQAQGLDALVLDLSELLRFTKEILGCEVTGRPLPDIMLLGMNAAKIREASHDVEREIGIPHPVPHHSMGTLAMKLNRLRTQVRVTELAGIDAFSRPGFYEREDILLGLNRLSSCVYILFCRLLASYYYERGEE
ncbi:MAG: hypothetical protein LBS36_02435 [Oscillospiraceae bacterium]|jgi:ethanolamine utilization cobalamin adenosyltransferase|nr:hypothetical protein [Oscillospiraceae bacterium]